MRMATRTIVWISVLAMLPFATAGAQQGAALEIDEVIVTARKRAESLQEVPIAITVFTAQTIERAGIERPADLSVFAASSPRETQSQRLRMSWMAY